jgi:mannan endo-1,4-beta-mannosidase
MEGKKYCVKSVLLLLTLFFFMVSATIQAETIRLEAENAVFSGGGTSGPQVMIEASCSGGKYVNTREGNLTFSYTITEAGYYSVLINVSASFGAKTITFRFDGGNTKDISLPQNDAFVDVILADNYYLSAGTHQIEMIKNWGWIRFDYLEISSSNNPPIEFNIDPLVTPQPSLNAERLYQFLLNNFGKKIISGVMTLKSLSTISGEYQNEISWLYERTGKKPALIGLDFLDQIGNIPANWVNNPDVITDAITWKNNKGIVAFCWHWRDPSHKTPEFYTTETSFDSRKIFDPNSSEYIAMMRDIDIIAGYLKQLQDAGVPVLWRPLHEAAGGWFWWGANGPEACKKIWQIMFEKFTNEHHLNNLIWVWTSDDSPTAPDWYPGDEYVDIIGLDVYDKGNHSSQLLTFEGLKKMFKGKKLLTLSECGSIPDIAAMKRDNAVWSYYMPWYSEHTKLADWNDINFWRQSLSDPDVISLEDMPDDIYTSIQPSVSDKFTIFAEKGLLHILTEQKDIYRIDLYDLTGRLYLTKANLDGNQTVSGLLQGYYLLSIESKDIKKSQKIRIP